MRDHCLLLRNHHPRCAARGNTYTHNIQSRFGRIHAPSSPNKCIHPRSTHTHLESKCENGSSEDRNHFQCRNSRRSRTRMSQLTACCVYVRSSNLCVALLPGTQHTKRLHDLVHGRQGCWLPVALKLLAKALHRRDLIAVLVGALTGPQLPPWRREKYEHSEVAGVIALALHVGSL